MKRAKTKRERVNHPAHYTFGKFEVIDVIEDWKLGFHLGNAVKYIARAGRKGSRIEDLKKDNVEVIGVSFDSAESHQKFISKYYLNFPLLVDTDGKIAEAYGTKMADRKMSRRVSFLIGLDGKIVHETDVPQAETHLSEMKAAVAKLKKG